MIGTPIEPAASVFVLLLGLVLGSFLNVCIHRLPLGLSVVRPRSACPSCGAPIAWYQNVPVASWIALRGRCAWCPAAISWRYPFVESLGGVTLLVLWRLYGPSAAFPITAFFALAMIALFFTDYDHQLLPDAITLTGLAAGMLSAPWSPFLGDRVGDRLWAAGTGAALGAGLLWIVGELYSRARHVEAMGLGDVKMMAMVGAFSGARGVLLTLFAASTIGAVVGLALIPLRGRSLRDTLPFGCFLAPAALAALLAGRRIAEWYIEHVWRTAGGA